MVFDTARLSIVAQVCNLLYRRFPIGGVRNKANIARIVNTPQAGSPAIQQTGSLRYVKRRAVYFSSCRLTYC
jgi:hypothetical protein